MASTPARLRQKQLLKNAVYGGLGAASYGSGTTWLRAQRRDPSALVVLMYHKVNDLPGNSLTVPPALFRQQMRELVRARNVITPQAFTAFLEDGAALPKRPALLTFDDGYRDNFTEAYPVLRELGLQSLLFLATDYVGTDKVFPHDRHLDVHNPNLSWDEVRAMSDVFTVASHGCSHQVMTTLSRAQAAREIAHSRTLIEQHLQQQVRFFSFPKGSVGHYDSGLVQAVLDAGYLRAFTTLPGALDPGWLRTSSTVGRYNCEPVGPWTFRRLLDGSCDAIGVKDMAAGAAVKRALNRAMGTVSR
jgi:peptidoglycan/xylan/chitin deacetylase (PgdA/CDA1 family)